MYHLPINVGRDGAAGNGPPQTVYPPRLITISLFFLVHFAILLLLATPSSSLSLFAAAFLTFANKNNNIDQQAWTRRIHKGEKDDDEKGDRRRSISNPIMQGN